MRLTKYTHSCVRLDDGDRRLVIDPGSFSPDGELSTVLDGVSAVLVTHEHVDHLDPDALAAAAEADPELRVWAPAAVCSKLDAHDRLRGRSTSVEAGATFTAGGLEVRAFGGQHALIHASIPMVANVGYLVGGAVLHPGDSFVVPEVPVERLLLPLHAPWSKVGEVLDHVIAVRPRHVHQIHDGLLNQRGQGLADGHVDRVTTRYGGAYARLETGESVDV
jgi:L-ascorbate metabolism protein UlaG (beta-lactamase superfamily)